MIFAFFLAMSEPISYIAGMIKRNLDETVQERLSFFPVVALLGPRQSGKTTLAKALFKEIPGSVYLDLERPSDIARMHDPESFFRISRGQVICLDEVQRLPEIFAVVRSVCDESETPGQFLLLGSASPALLRQSSESLAGRINYLVLTPFLLSEVGENELQKLWLRGGFPRSFLAPSEALSKEWRESFITTFLERDLPQLGIRVPSLMLRRFWQMCAHIHGDLWNASKVSQSLGVTGKTVNYYLDILTQAYVMRRLEPYVSNTKKRLVKSPKVYLRDTGLLHQLLRIETHEDLMGHPAFGASWEGFVIEHILSITPDWEPFFYRSSAGAELDLVLRKGQRTLAIECKASVAPKLHKGFWNAVDDVQPDNTWVVAPVDSAYPLSENVWVTPLAEAMRRMPGGWNGHSAEKHRLEE